MINISVAYYLFEGINNNKKYCPKLTFSYRRKVSISLSKCFTFSLSLTNYKPLFLTLP